MVDPITFVTVVESGGIELSALKMVRSLRKWGGTLADRPVLFVTPRFGPPLAGQTRKEMAQLGVEHIHAKSDDRYEWYNFLNKPVAVVAAARWPRMTEQFCWIDADFLVVGDCGELTLRPDEDIALCAADLNMGSLRDGDRFDAYWRRYCEVLGLPFERLGTVQVHRENVRARTYFNGGLMMFRTACGFAEAYLADTVAALDARFRSSTEGIFMHEQMAIGVTCRKLGLRVRELPWTLNFTPNDAPDHPDVAARSLMLHYHHMMWPEAFTQVREFFDRYHADKTPALTEEGAIDIRQVPLAWRALSKVLKKRRLRRATNYLASCENIPTPPV